MTNKRIGAVPRQCGVVAALWLLSSMARAQAPTPKPNPTASPAPVIAAPPTPVPTAPVTVIVVPGAAPVVATGSGTASPVVPLTPPNTVAAATPVPTPTATPVPALPARGTYNFSGDAKQLSVFAVAVDAQELFTALASKANMRLVVDDTVSRKITVSIAKRPAREIVEDIISAYGLAAADVEGVTMISEGIPRSPSSYLLSDIDAIPTKYVDAANARNLLPVFLQDYVKVNSDQNAVVLSAPTEVLQKFREDIAQFDIPASQILVDLLVVELTDTTSDQLGLNLIWQNNSHGATINASTGSLVYNTTTSLPDKFSATLQALQQKGKARVHANPRIATVSGRHASIFVGRQRYVATPIDTGGGQVNHIDAGVRLDITPYTGGKGQVLVDVDTEVSTLSAPDPHTNLPEKSTRTARATVRVRDGETIVIGGLRQQEARDVRTKIPVLGGIPIIGPLLFQTKNVTSTQTELMIFITPRVLSTTGHLPTEQEQMMRERFLNPEFNAPMEVAPDATEPALPPKTVPQGGLPVK